jgi:hypothetical protein
MMCDRTLVHFMLLYHFRSPWNVPMDIRLDTISSGSIPRSNCWYPPPGFGYHLSWYHIRYLDEPPGINSPLLHIQISMYVLVCVLLAPVLLSTIISISWSSCQRFIFEINKGNSHNNTNDWRSTNLCDSLLAAIRRAVIYKWRQWRLAARHRVDSSISCQCEHGERRHADEVIGNDRSLCSFHVFWMSD